MRKVALQPMHFLLLALGLLGLVLAGSGCERKRTPNYFLFPKDFVGWASVRYGVAGADALPMEAGCVYIDFRSANSVTTSSTILKGWAKDRYEEEADNGRKGLYNGRSSDRAVQEHFYEFSSDKDNRDASVEYLFVGTANQLNRNPKPAR